MQPARAFNSESGVSLIITFFVFVIILSVVLSVSVILYSEIKIIRNIGDSVVAFHAADSGVEKTLYYDRKVVLADASGGKRGVCSMCDAQNPTCPASGLGDPEISCACEPNSGANCDPKNCENCEINFSTVLSSSPEKSYKLKAVVTQLIPPENPSLVFSKLSIYSTGSYNSVYLADPVKRAIQMDVLKDETGDLPPQIVAYVSKIAVQTGELISISANVNAYGHGVKSVDARIRGYYYGQLVLDEIHSLAPESGNYTDGTYEITAWSSNTEAAYVVDVTACDKKDKCGTATIINKPQ